MEVYSQGMLPNSGLPYQSNMTDIVDIIFEQWKPWKQRVATEVFSMSRTHAENYIVYWVHSDKSFLYGGKIRYGKQK